MAIFIVAMGLLAGLRHLFDISIPSYENLTTSTLLPTESEVEYVMNDEMEKEYLETEDVSDEESGAEVIQENEEEKEPDITIPDSINKNTTLYRLSGKIWSYDECLADTQEQHIYAAKKYGIKPVYSHEEVTKLASKYKVVSISDSPFYVIDKLDYSMPYLVPSAKELLTKISVNFIDSLRSKGYPVYLPIVSSVLRTTSDVEKLKKRNRNATDDSCHSYGTTFDITYSRFMPLTGISTPVDSAEWKSSELKLTLAEVLYDLRAQGECYVKHEKRQPCFHITVRR